jgi:hypothetical protein
MGEFLNSSLQFEKLPWSDRRSFAAIPRKVLLPGGTILYRFVTYAEERRDPSYRLPSPFWLPNDTYAELGRLHKETDIAMTELVRGTMALAFDFKSAISGLMRGRLCRGAWALRGTIAAQPVLGRGNKELANGRPGNLRKINAPGGLEQVYVPNLEWGDLFDVAVVPLSREGSARFLFDEI